MNKILPLFSYIFHPLFISVYAVLIFSFFGDNYFENQEIYLVIIQITIITIFIPISFYYLLLTLGKVDSIMLADKAQRKFPLLIHAILLFILIKKSITIDGFFELYFFFLGSLISTVLALVMVFAGYKASLHMIGMTALSVFTIGLSLHFQVRLLFLILPLLLCCGLVASSRLQMKAHNNFELFLGSCIGILPQIGVMYFWL